MKIFLPKRQAGKARIPQRHHPAGAQGRRIGTWRDRAGYAEHWESEFKAMEQHLLRVRSSSPRRVKGRAARSCSKSSAGTLAFNTTMTKLDWPSVFMKVQIRSPYLSVVLSRTTCQYSCSNVQHSLSTTSWRWRSSSEAVGEVSPQA
jgi:hypothetical protein